MDADEVVVATVSEQEDVQPDRATGTAAGIA